MSFHKGSCQLYSDKLKFILNCLCQGKLFLVRHRARRRARMTLQLPHEFEGYWVKPHQMLARLPASALAQVN